MPDPLSLTLTARFGALVQARACVELAPALQARAFGDGDPAATAALLAGARRGLRVAYQLAGPHLPPAPILERETRELLREVEIAWRGDPREADGSRSRDKARPPLARIQYNTAR